MISRIIVVLVLLSFSVVSTSGPAARTTLEFHGFRAVTKDGTRFDRREGVLTSRELRAAADDGTMLHIPREDLGLLDPQYGSKAAKYALMGGLTGGFSAVDVFILIDLDYAAIGREELNVSTGILAWEGEFLIPPEFAILSKSVRNHSLSAIEHSTNLIVGLSPVLTAAETPTDLVHYRIGYFAGPDAPVDVWVTLGPSSPSSFDSESPGFNDNVDVGECTKTSDGTPVTCLRPFAAVFGAVINCRTRCFWVPIETPSWSAIKASYGG